MLPEAISTWFGTGRSLSPPVAPVRRDRNASASHPSTVTGVAASASTSDKPNRLQASNSPATRGFNSGAGDSLTILLSAVLSPIRIVSYGGPRNHSGICSRGQREPEPAGSGARSGGAQPLRLRSADERNHSGIYRR